MTPLFCNWKSLPLNLLTYFSPFPHTLLSQPPVFLCIYESVSVWLCLFKKAESRRIDAFELWCCRRLLRVPWTARRSNQSILKEISPGCSLEGLMLKLKLQYFCHLMRRADSFEKTLMGPWCWERLRVGGEGDDRGWMASPTWWTWVWVDSGVSDGQGALACCSSWGCKESDTTERLNWTDLFILFRFHIQVKS